MAKTFLRCCAPLILLLLSPAAVYAEGVAEDLTRPCKLTLPHSTAVVRARCAQLQVAENPLDPQSKQITLEIAVLPAKSSNPSPDPVFFLAGGPGQSSIDTLIQQSGLFREIIKKRDVVFVDQRGTGRSNPLQCDLQETFDIAPSDEQIRALTAQCVKGLQGDPRYYSTVDAVADLEAVRIALGYGSVNLYGGSYGTRVAQEYVRRYPLSSRSIVIDGVVYPPDLLGMEHSRNLTEALWAQAERCQDSEPCAAAYPHLLAELERYLSMDVKAVREVEFRDPRTGQWRKMEVNRELIDVAIRLLSYDAKSQALVPLMIHRAASGEWRELVAQAILVSEQLAGTMSGGMHHAVMCSEDVPFYPQDIEAGNAILGGLPVLMQLVCSEWPVATADSQIHQPLHSDVPALLLSGEMDPVTPPRYGDKALQQFTNGRHLTGLGLGHIISSNRCFKKLVAGFIHNLEVAKEDMRCAERDWSSSFFTSMSGPEL